MRAAIILLMAISAQIDGPARTQVQQQGSASLWLNRPSGDSISVRFSETLTIALRVEGAAPLVVAVESAKSTEFWYLEKTGTPTTTSLDESKRTLWEQVYTARPLQPGKHPLQLPALQITENNGPEQEVKWQPLTVEVTTRVAKVDISEARDRTTIEEVPPPPVANPPCWPWLLTAVPIAALLTFAVWRWCNRPTVEASAHEVAIWELQMLETMSLTNAEEIKLFFTKLSDMLRRYLEKRLGLPATQQTTPEFFAALASKSALSAQQQQILSDLLRRCDLAKFADMNGGAEECKALSTAAKDFIRQSSGVTLATPAPP